MVSHRVITLTLNGISITRTISRGCPQGGVLSPFLWNLTLNDLLSNHNLDTSFIQAFADDLSIIVGGIDIPTIRAICQRYLIIIDKWCTTIGVKLSSLKTQAIMFTRKRLWTLDKPLSLRGINIHLVNEVKYLGITLDSKLLWRPHINALMPPAIKLSETYIPSDQHVARNGDSNPHTHNGSTNKSLFQLFHMVQWSGVTSLTPENGHPTCSTTLKKQFYP